MKLATRAAMAVLALSSWAAQAATFEVPVEGTDWEVGYSGGHINDDGSITCFSDLHEPSFCEQGRFHGRLSITIPSLADGVYLAGIGGSPTEFALLNFSLGPPDPDYNDGHPPFEVTIARGQVVSIYGSYFLEAGGFTEVDFSGRSLHYRWPLGSHGSGDIQALLVPEPAGGVLLLAGLVALGARRVNRARGCMATLKSRLFTSA